jgi:hypothetical protein
MKEKKSKRRYNTYLKAKKQKNISLNKEVELGYFFKQNAMDCGNSKCVLCGNPRKHKKFSKNETLTKQEKLSDIIFKEQKKDLL